MADALISFPGLAVNDYGGHGSLQTLSARGMGSQHTAVSMNGVPVENAQTGSIDLGGIYLNGLSGALLDQTPGAIAQPPGTAELNLNYRPSYDQWQVKAGAGGFGEWLGAIGTSVVKDSLRARLDAQYLHSREDYPFEVNGESGERSASNPRIANGQMYLERHFRSGSRVQYFARGGYKRLTVPPAVVSGNLNAPGSELQQGDLWHFVRLSYDRSEHVFGEGHAFLKHRFQHLNYADRVSDSQYRLHHTTASYTTPLLQPRQSASAASDTTRSGGYHHRLKFNAQYKLYALKSEELFLGIEDTRSQTQRHLGAWALHYAGGATRFVNLDASARLSVANETVPVLPSVTLKLEKPIVKLPLVVVPYVYTAYSGRYPSFNELYFFGFGNPELPPEKRWQLSGGVAISGKRPDRLTVRTSVYHTRTIDRIIAVPLSPVRWSTRSFGLTKTLGGELSVNAKPWRWLPLMASANYQQARDYSLTDGNRLPYIPDWTFKAGATPTLRGWQLGGANPGHWHTLPRRCQPAAAATLNCLAAKYMATMAQ